jgi:hypothetical protein
VACAPFAARCDALRSSLCGLHSGRHAPAITLGEGPSPCGRNATELNFRGVDPVAVGVNGCLQLLPSRRDAHVGFLSIRTPMIVICGNSSASLYLSHPVTANRSQCAWALERTRSSFDLEQHGSNDSQPASELSVPERIFGTHRPGASQ